MNSEIKSSDLIALFLKEKKIEIVFGIIGSANSHIFDSIANLGYTKIICTHHEQAAVMAAGAYYRTNGKLSAALVTAGAGSANAITGVLSLWADSIPCIVISGQENTKHIDIHSNLRMIGVQGFDVCKMVNGIVKFCTTVKNKNDILKSFEKAYYIALDARMGPVWIDMPMDMQSAILQNENLIHFEIPTKNSTDLQINEVISLLQNARKPIVLAGHGIRLSGSQLVLREFVEKFKIPVLVSWSGIDILPHNHPYYFGTCGIFGQRCANFVVQNCDLILVLGSRLSLQQTGYNINNFSTNAKIIMVNNDKSELEKYQRYNIKIEADCNDFLNAIFIKNIQLDIDNWYNQCVKYKNDFPFIEGCHQNNEKYENSYVLVNRLSRILKENDIIIIGQGSPLPCCHQAFERKEGQILFASNGLGEMGNGLPSAIGAAFAKKGQEIVLLDGDGSMMINLQELQTLVGYNLPIKIIIFNNNGYLFIKHTQKLFFHGRYVAVSPETGVTLPNFEKISFAFDIPYFNSKKNTLEDFIVNHRGCGIYEYYMNPEQDLLPKVKGTITSNEIIAHPLEDMSPLLPINMIEKNMFEVKEVSYKIRL